MRMAGAFCGTRRGSSPRRVEAAAMLKCICLLLLLTLPALASDVLEGLDHPVGHPRDRFPLSVSAEKTGEADLDAAVQKAIDDWNQVFHGAFGLDAWKQVDQD